MAVNLIVFRTHFVDERLLAFAHQLSREGEYQVVFALDESAGEIDAGGFAKTSLTRERFAEHGLLSDVSDVFWRCGDYSLYFARIDYPEASYYWLCEYDVLINRADPLTFFKEIDSLTTADFLSSHFREPESWWGYGRPLEGLYPKVMRSYFPLVRLSAHAVDHAFRQRVADSEVASRTELKARPEWPNDEAFTATVLYNAGFQCADFNAFGSYYDRETFWLQTLKHPSQITAFDDKLYHAVRTGSAYLKLVHEKSYVRPLPTALELLGLFADHDITDSFVEPLCFVLVQQSQNLGDNPLTHFGENGIIHDLLAANSSRPVMRAVVLALGRQRKIACIEWLRRNRRRAGWPHVDELENLALGRPAWQSSICKWSKLQDYRLDAEGANDGRTQVEYGFHTDWEPSPFWTVDLGHPHRLDEIVIFNRIAEANRLKNFHILVSADAQQWSLAHESLLETLKAEQPIRVPLNVTGRYVRITLPRREALHLREVEIYGCQV